MRVGKIVAISVVSLASLIVIVVAAAAITFFVSNRSGNQQNFAPPEGPQAVSPVGDMTLVSKASGSSSFLYRESQSHGTNERLTAASSGIESEASFSHNGKLVVYSFASSPNSKSAVWVVGADGRNPHPITGADEDALHPVFSPDDSTVFYAASSFTGNHSPIVRPARHDWDVFSVPVQPGAVSVGTGPTRITHTSFYDLRSLDVAADKIWGGTRVLISTSGYPIGALLEEFTNGASGKDKIFQPHVPGESSAGPSFGEARFIHDGMDVLFLAATDTPGGNYDYNVYSMSDVTGTEIKQLTHLKGPTTELAVLPDGKVTFVNGGVAYLLDVNSQTTKPL
jgi:Tol biopolymer transport system component